MGEKSWWTAKKAKARDSRFSSRAIREKEPRTVSKKTRSLPLKILVVDDSPATLEVIQRNLNSEGYQVFTATSVQGAVDFLEENPIDLVVTDLKLPKISGLDLVRYVRENLEDAEVMMITGYPSIEGAVEAVKTGAEEYLVKPFTDKELVTAVQRMIKKLDRRRRARSKTFRSQAFGIIGESPVMQDVFKLIEKASSTQATVLISGESGTGKELVARAVHYGGNRRSAPFVPVNCTAIPDNLIESELFGHVKGAFTDARDSRAGFFQIADGGTIFFDEIGDASLNMQGKLLRVMQDKTIYMVGSSRAHHVDTRVIAATNKDLLSLVEKDVFREDLYYRINVIHVIIPPLRERGDDIMLLINFFLEKFSKEMNRPAHGITDEALRILADYHWPGNVRELENLIQRLVVITEGDTIDVSELPAAMKFCVRQSKGLNRTLADVEAEHIRDVLESVNGNKTKAAEILGIDRKTLREKMKK
ncbi:MAG: sigma-54-dependent Fis family transcriptional regulator [Desulfobacteraceae bacterium]|nr:MAG: sigma-54-dependent Fis family transcriptional regulator [Desulfobacteraceae bacterium]